MKNRAIVDINGKNYTLISEKSRDYIIRIGSYVDSKIKEIHSQCPTLSTTDASVLAATFIAEELLLLRDEYNAMDDRISKALEQNSSAKEEPTKEKEKSSVLPVSNQISNKASRLFSPNTQKLNNPLPSNVPTEPAPIKKNTQESSIDYNLPISQLMMQYQKSKK